jgi:hypothetical protein
MSQPPSGRAPAPGNRLPGSAFLDRPPEGETVRIVVPLAPGGVSDILGSRVAPALTARIDRGAIVDDRAGAGGAISVEPARKPSLAHDVPHDRSALTIAAAGRSPCWSATVCRSGPWVNGSPVRRPDAANPTALRPASAARLGSRPIA